MNHVSAMLQRLDYHIQVASILLDISKRTFGSPDANLNQHLAELTTSRRALERNSRFFTHGENLTATTGHQVSSNTQQQPNITPSPT